MHIAFNRTGRLLVQESHLAKNAILSGFDLLLKANYFQDREGYFYSAFFNISIGMERMLKLAVVTHHMLADDYQPPSKGQLKGYGHRINELLEKCQSLIKLYAVERSYNFQANAVDSTLVRFFTDFAVFSRYFNFDALRGSGEVKTRDPLFVWFDIARAIYDENTSFRTRERAAEKIMNGMEEKFGANSFTSYLSEDGHPMLLFDLLYAQYFVEKSAPLIIWRLVNILRPVYFLLMELTSIAVHYENDKGIKQMVIPHYEDFFYFLLADKKAIKERKQWLKTFNSECTY